VHAAVSPPFDRIEIACKGLVVTSVLAEMRHARSIAAAIGQGGPAIFQVGCQDADEQPDMGAAAVLRVERDDRPTEIPSPYSCRGCPGRSGSAPGCATGRLHSSLPPVLSFPRSSVGMQCGRSASRLVAGRGAPALAPTLERGSQMTSAARSTGDRTVRAGSGGLRCACPPYGLHAAAPRSSWPVTAAVMRAWRYSWRRFACDSIACRT